MTTPVTGAPVNLHIDGLPLSASTTIMPVGLNYNEVSATFARPNDSIAYTAKDVVSNSTSAPAVMTFTDIGRVNGGSGNIIKARLFIDSATAMLGAAFRLHLYHTAPTAVNDNAAFPLLYANRDKRVGYLDLPATATEGAGSDSSAAIWVDMPVGFKCASGSKTLYGILEITTVGASPTGAHNIWVSIMVENH